MSNESSQIIEQQLEATLDELYAALGEEVSGPGIAGSSKNNQLLGRKWLNKKRAQLSAILCNNSSLRSLCNDSKKETRVILVASVIDLIASLITGVSPTTVAVILVKEGLNTLCEEAWM